MTNLLFVIFFNFVFYIGRGIVKIYLKLKNNDLEISKLYISKHLKIEIFFPLIALFFYGNILFISNFFIPIKKLIFYLLFILILIFLYGIFDKLEKKKLNLNFITNNIIFPLIISISTYGIRFHYDATAYHLGIQNWIYSSKISFGLLNINPFYSYAGLNEYISASYFIFDNFIIQHFTHLVFFVVFYNFLFYSIKQESNLFLRNSSILILIFSILDNFGFNGGSNGYFQIQTIGKQDVGVGVIYVLTFIIFLNNLLIKNIEKSELVFLTFLSLMAFQLKINSVYLIFLIFFYIYEMKVKRIKIFIRSYLFFLMLLLLWLVKSIIISGCLIFPILITCSNKFIWTNLNDIVSSSAGTIDGNFAYRIGSSISEWFNTWIQTQFNFQVFSNYSLSVITIYIISKLAFEKSENLKFNFRIKIYLTIFMIIPVFVFFITTPVYRNAYGLFLTFVIFLAINTGNFKNYKIISLRIILISLIISISAIPRGYMYKEFFQNPFTIKKVSIELIQYKSTFSEPWVNPKIENGPCWDNMYCIMNTQKVKELNFYNYRVFIDPLK